MSASLLMLVQVDDATGEILQDVAERLHRAGVRNLQVLASLGKKGRPGHVLLIDIDESLEEPVALILGTELGVWGYRVLESRHRHFDIRIVRERVRLRHVTGVLEDEVGIKQIRKGDRLLASKAEHADLARLRDALEAMGTTVSLRQLRSRIEAGRPDADGVRTILLDGASDEPD